MAANSIIQNVYENVQKRNHGETEFLQAVKEVLDSLGPVIINADMTADLNNAIIVDNDLLIGDGGYGKVLMTGGTLTVNGEMQIGNGSDGVFEMSFGTTYGLGRAACYYFYHKKKGDVVSKQEMQDLYIKSFKKAKAASGYEKN